MLHKVYIIVAVCYSHKTVTLHACTIHCQPVVHLLYSFMMPGIISLHNYGTSTRCCNHVHGDLRDVLCTCCTLMLMDSGYKHTIIFKNINPSACLIELGSLSIG